MRCFYHPDYHLPLPEGHPFPMEKFTEAHAMLAQGGFLRDLEMVEPCDEARLMRVHTADYLDRLRLGNIDGVEKSRLGLPPGEPLYRRSALEVEGTRRALFAALEDGIAANLAGGTHHAFADRGEGFCVLNDVAVSVRDLHAVDAKLRVFILDTDAHQGNGTNALLGEDERIFTCDLHVGANYPSRKIAASLDLPMPRFVGDELWLETMRKHAFPALRSFRPDLVVWISGADPHCNDRFGQMQLSLKAMMTRDREVVGFVREAGWPLAILYGGGYNRTPGWTAKLHALTIRAALTGSGD